jgi:hypothetical protein
MREQLPTKRQKLLREERPTGSQNGTPSDHHHAETSLHFPFNPRNEEVRIGKQCFPKREASSKFDACYLGETAICQNDRPAG